MISEAIEALPQVLNSRTVYEGAIISLHVDEIALPGERVATREVVARVEKLLKVTGAWDEFKGVAPAAAAAPAATEAADADESDA